MKIIDLRQGTPEWLEWRSQGVSASEAGIILNRNPYKTVWRLWAEQTGYANLPDLENNPCVRRGNQYEDVARRCAEKHFSEILLPLCCESSENSIIRASLDGSRKNRQPVELKCPYPKNWHDAVERREDSEIYRLYYPQVQSQIYVCEAQMGWLCIYSVEEDDYLMFPIERDDALISELQIRAADFYRRVRRKEAPPKDPERDIFIPTGDDARSWISAAEHYRYLEQKKLDLEFQLEQLTEMQEPYLDAMKGIMHERQAWLAEFAGVRIKEHFVSGKVNYKKLLLEEAGVSKVDSTLIDKYRSPSSKRYRVTVTNQAMPRTIVDKDVAQSLAGVADGPIDGSKLH